MYKWIAIFLPLICFQSIKVFGNEVKSDLVLDLKEKNDLILEPWDSPQGILRLQRSQAKANFWKLARFYESQIRLTYCGIATSVVVLNALSIQAPPSKFLGRYRMFTQEDFFSEDVEAMISQKDVAERGVSLDELSRILKVFPLEVKKYEAQSLSYEEIHLLLVSALKNPKKCVLSLYQRKALDQDGGGHWSPVAAYDEDSDSFLIMDVAKFKYPPTWISAPAFIRAMQTANMYGMSRGFIVISADLSVAKR